MEINGKGYPIFKNPKDGGFKTSQKGLCFVYKEDGKYKYKDEFTSETIPDNNLLIPIFRDGKMLKEQSLIEIRNILNNNKF